MSNEIKIQETSPNAFIEAVIAVSKEGHKFVPNTFYSSRTAHHVSFEEVKPKTPPKKTGKGKVTAETEQK